MKIKYSNPCYRCGKERIFVRAWKEETGAREVTTTQTVCPDSACQKTVDKELKNQEERIKILAKRKEERILARKKGRRVNVSHAI